MNYTVKERKKARSSNTILVDELGTFFMASIAFFFIPLGLAKRAKRSKSIHKANGITLIISISTTPLFLVCGKKADEY